MARHTRPTQDRYPFTDCTLRDKVKADSAWIFQQHSCSIHMTHAPVQKFRLFFMAMSGLRGSGGVHREICGAAPICKALNAPLWSMGSQPLYRGAAGRIVGQCAGRWPTRRRLLLICGTRDEEFAPVAFSQCTQEKFLLYQGHFLLLYKDIFSARALESPPRGTSAH